MSETVTRDEAGEPSDDSVEEQTAESLTTAPRDSDAAARPAVPGARAGSAGGGGGAVTLPKLGTFGMLRWAWRQLTSMRIALILLFLLSMAAVPGSLLPQRNGNTDPAKVVDYLQRHKTIGPILDKLQFFEVYKSPWFAAIYLLLFVSLIGCIVPRTWAHAKVLRKPPPPAPRNLARMPVHTEWQDETANPEAVKARLDAAEKYLRGKRFRVVRGEDGAGGGWISAEKGYLREVGNLVFHLALVGILAGFAIKGYYGYKGKVLVTEGQTFTNAQMYYDDQDFGGGVDPNGIPPFQIKLDKFDAQYEEDPNSGKDFGQPRGFEAYVSYTSAGTKTPKQKTITENHPLSVDGANIYLISHGYAPVITVKDPAGKVVFRDAVRFFSTGPMEAESGVVKVLDGIKSPDGFPTQLGFQGFFLPTFDPTMANGPASLFPAAKNPALLLSGYYGNSIADSFSVYSLGSGTLKRLDLGSKDGLQAAKLAPGQTLQLPDNMGSVTFEGIEQYVQFDINHDPSKQLVLPSAVAIVAGLVLSLGIRRRRVFVRVKPAGGAADPASGSLVGVEVAGLARAEDARLRDEVRSVRAALRVRKKATGGSTAGPVPSGESTESGAGQ